MTFEEDVHTMVWGAESWLVSAHSSFPSRIVGTGKTLRDVMPSFPLLIKKIRADQRLSVQVHPNEQTAKSVGGEPKTEMWYVLKSGPIFAGFKPGVCAADVQLAVRDGSFEELLVRFESQVGECYFIPGGMVHAIGEGTSVFEVQQSSDTTYRLYDWGRLGTDGKPRPLHIREALDVMDISLPPPVPSAEVHCPYFDFFRVPSGTLSPVDGMRIVYTPAAESLRLLESGASATVESESLVTLVK